MTKTTEPIWRQWASPGTSSPSFLLRKYTFLIIIMMMMKIIPNDSSPIIILIYGNLPQKREVQHHWAWRWHCPDYHRDKYQQLMMPTLKCAKVLTRETWRSSSEKNSAMNFLRVWGPCGMSVPGTVAVLWKYFGVIRGTDIGVYLCISVHFH